MPARVLLLALLAVAALPATAFAETLALAPTTVAEWKAVYGRIEARDTIAARARIGGTVIELDVVEGDSVEAGQRIATVRDDKLAFQVDALDAQLRAIQSQLDNARNEVARGETLLERGITTTQRLDQLRTQVDVFSNQLASTEAQRQVVMQQASEGDVIAPADGRVLVVPVTRGAVILPGESVATIGGGGIFLRLAIPERHAVMLEEGASLEIGTGAKTLEGTLAKIYPQIENGRVIADVDVPDLDTAFVDARILVRVPVGERTALLVPRSAVATRSGLDFVTVDAGDEGEVARTVVLGETIVRDGVEHVEVLTGLSAGDVVILP
ncbi:MAG TPA: efflux RND transporter periplasmic adaptor subunit [Methylomirabilota bacterium]|nr:efflux RND transporter periplasmic adaptor subunit [Methylomirabilota bacterium]